MKISTRGRYALRMMLDMVIEGGEDSRIPLKDVANRQGISEKYLEQIVPALTKAGYVNSVRGAKGGYSLSMSPDEITVGGILRAVEGGFAPAPCAENDEESFSCRRISDCMALDVWIQIREAVEGVVDNITLAQLIQRQKDKNCSCGQ